MDCAPTFDDLLDLDDSDDNGNFQNIQIESADQPQQGNNSLELRNDNSLRKRKYDFVPETCLQTPPRTIASNRDAASDSVLGTRNPGNQSPKDIEYIANNRDSASHSILGTHNPGNKLPKGTKYKNRIPKLEDYRLYNTSDAPHPKNFQMPNLKANLAFPYPGYSSHQTGQEAFENARRQQNEFRSAYPQRNESHQGYPQIIYGQTFATNILQPDNTSDFAKDLSRLFPQNRIHAIGYTASDPYIDYTKLQQNFALNASHPSLMNPHSNKRVLENNFENQKILHPSMQQQTAVLNYSTKNERTMDKDVQLLGQNKHSSTDLVSETEIQNDSRCNSATSFRNCNSSDPTHGEIQHVKDERRNVKNDLDGYEYPNAVRNTSHPSEQQKNTEKKITQQKQVEKHAEQKKDGNRAQEKHVEKNLKREKDDESSEQQFIDESAETESSDESAEPVSTDESAEPGSTNESAEQENAEKSFEQENTEKIFEQENAEKKSFEQENAKKKSFEQENAKKSFEQQNAQKSTDQENAEKNSEQENAEKSSEQENAEKSSEQENAKKRAEQENSEVFTGKGYESWDDFIKALNDGTLYKR